MNGKKVQIIWRWIALCMMMLLSCFMAGYGFTSKYIIENVVIATLCNVLIVGLIATCSSKWASQILLVYLLTVALYLPIGWTYGPATFSLAGALLETNHREAGEFFTAVPKTIWLMQLAFVACTVFIVRCSRDIFMQMNQLSQKAKHYVWCFAMTCLVATGLKGHLLQDNLADGRTGIPIPIIGLYADLGWAPYAYWTQKQELLTQAQQASTWQIEKVEPKYKNYVLVIGESVRSDYMHAYGFKLPNTPWLSQTNGVLLDGYISTASSTMLSIPKTLSLPKQANNNVISLAKQAGFTTSWLSNQEMLGYATPTISTFAMRSDYFYFAQRGQQQKNIILSDARLLPELQKVLQQPAPSSRLIVLHLMGSHADFCQRVEDKILFHYENKNLSCYVTSIAQTDQLLADIIAILQQQQESYSMMYFADHGLKHIGYGEAKTLTHGDDKYQNFTVPLFKVSSDDTERVMIKTQRSAFNFLQGFAQWTGIQTKEFQQRNDDFWREMPDLPEPSNNLQRVNGLAKDDLSSD